MSLAQGQSPLQPRRPELWIKVCGITSAEAVAAALACGVDAIGFVFAPSVRRMAPVDAAELAAPARGRCALVAVTLHPTQHSIDEILRSFKPDALQTELTDLITLHLPASLTALPVMRTATTAALPTRVLFDGQVSGSGQTANWSAAEPLARVTELILAGGLNAANVAAAIQAVRPFGVDVSSGVESAPGRKSPEMIAQFVQAARAAVREPI